MVFNPQHSFMGFLYAFLFRYTLLNLPNIFSIFLFLTPLFLCSFPFFLFLPFVSYTVSYGSILYLNLAWNILCIFFVTLYIYFVGSFFFEFAPTYFFWFFCFFAFTLFWAFAFFFIYFSFLLFKGFPSLFHSLVNLLCG